MYSRFCMAIISHPRESSLVTDTKVPLMKTPVTKGKLNSSSAREEYPAHSAFEVNSAWAGPSIKGRSATNFMTSGFGVISA